MATTDETARQRPGAAAVVGGGLAVAAASGEEQQPSPARRAAVAGTILVALVGWLAAQRERSAAWLRERLAGRGAPDDIELVIAEEQRRDDAFAEKQAQRVAVALQSALALPSRQAREQAVRAVMSREEVYVRQRAEAQAARAVAAIDRTVLRQTSPGGAFWRLDPGVAEHTAGCLLMGGRFWPWSVLDRVHPPRHAGCPCRLLSYGEAIAEGLMAPGGVMDVRAAVRRAAGVVMEAQMYSAAAEDAGALRDLLFEACLIEREDEAMSAGLVCLADVERARGTLALGLGELDGAGVGRDANGVFVYGTRERTSSRAALAEFSAADVAAVVG